MGRAKNTNGVIRGRLIGGNLTVYTSILGTHWQDDAERCILLFEDGELSPTSSHYRSFESYMQ